jgi:serine/threonine protein kinase
VKVLDFGLVTPQQAEGQTRLDITAENAARGTPGFMAPEQVVGDRPADGRSDIYALGCLGYWLITGRLVFTGRTAFETILQHVQAEPSPPSASSPNRIPRSLDDLILSCLAKNPDERPSTADAVAARLDTIEADCAGSAESLREWWDLHSPPASRSRQAETT